VRVTTRAALRPGDDCGHGGGSQRCAEGSERQCTTPQNTPATLNVLANDSDADARSTRLGHVGHAAGFRHRNGEHQTGAITYAPAAGYSGTVSFTYTVKDTAAPPPMADGDGQRNSGDRRLNTAYSAPQRIWLCRRAGLNGAFVRAVCITMATSSVWPSGSVEHNDPRKIESGGLDSRQHVVGHAISTACGLPARIFRTSRQH